MIWFNYEIFTRNLSLTLTWEALSKSNGVRVAGGIFIFISIFCWSEQVVKNKENVLTKRRLDPDTTTPTTFQHRCLRPSFFCININSLFLIPDEDISVERHSIVVVVFYVSCLLFFICVLSSFGEYICLDHSVFNFTSATPPWPISSLRGRELLLKQYPRTGQWQRALTQTVSTHRTMAESSCSNSIHAQDSGWEILLKQYPHTGQWQRDLTQTVSTHRTVAERSYSNSIHTQDNGRELLLKQYPRTGQWQRDLAQTVSTHRTMAESSCSNSIHAQDNGRELLLKQYPRTGQWQRALAQTVSTHRTVAERSCSNSIHTQDSGREILLKQYPHTGQWQRDLAQTVSTHRTMAESSCSNSIHAQDSGREILLKQYPRTGQRPGFCLFLETC